MGDDETLIDGSYKICGSEDAPLRISSFRAKQPVSVASKVVRVAAVAVLTSVAAARCWCEHPWR